MDWKRSSWLALGSVSLVGLVAACQGGSSSTDDADQGLGGAGSGGTASQSGTGGTADPDLVPAPPTCGNGALDPGEQCDAALLGDKTCVALGYDSGTLDCASSCKFDVSGCVGDGPVCGDATIAGAEECEGANLNGKTCATEGYDGGTLKCLSSCYFDKSECQACGNGILEPGEDCDSTDLGDKNCSSLDSNYPLGEVKCGDDCKVVSVSCHSETDMDADGVLAGIDPNDGNKYVCGDEDADGCDDCTKAGTKDVMNDGYDPSGDGKCETALDPACMHGENAATDTSRELACVVFSLMNADRAHFTAESGGAAPLTWSEAIWEVSFAHSKDMCDRNYFAHDTLGTSNGPSERAAAQGLSFGLAENIAKNWGPNAVEFAFMDEPTCTGHRGNILTPKATEAAIGYYLCPTDDNVHIVTADYRWNFSIGDSAYCKAAATDCEVPPEPLTTAVCRGVEVSWGLCDRTDGAKLLSDWGCPSD